MPFPFDFYNKQLAIFGLTSQSDIKPKKTDTSSLRYLSDVIAFTVSVAINHLTKAELLEVNKNTKFEFEHAARHQDDFDKFIFEHLHYTIKDLLQTHKEITPSIISNKLQQILFEKLARPKTSDTRAPQFFTHINAQVAASASSDKPKRPEPILEESEEESEEESSTLIRGVQTTWV